MGEQLSQALHLTVWTMIYFDWWSTCSHNLAFPNMTHRKLSHRALSCAWHRAEQFQFEFPPGALVIFTPSTHLVWVAHILATICVPKVMLVSKGGVGQVHCSLGYWWWKEQFEELLNPTNMPFYEDGTRRVSKDSGEKIHIQDKDCWDSQEALQWQSIQCGLHSRQHTEEHCWVALVGTPL